MELPVRFVPYQDEAASLSHPVVDLVIQANEEHRVGMIAHAVDRYLRQATAANFGSSPRNGDPLTLAYRKAGHARWFVLAMSDRLSDVPLRPGSDVCVLSAGTRQTATICRRRAPAAWLHWMSPCQRRLSYPLYWGHNTIGRGWHCTVRVTDPHFGRTHSDLWIDSDLQRNAVTITLRQQENVTRVTVSGKTRLKIGRVECVVELVAKDVDAIPGTPERPEALNADYPYQRHLPAGRARTVPPRPKLMAPPVPSESKRNRGLAGGLLVSTAISAIAYLVTGHAAMLSMVGLSAAMGLGTWIEGWYTARRSRRNLRRDFGIELQQWIRELGERQQDHLHQLDVLAPDLETTVATAKAVAPELWSQPVTGENSLRIRLGVTCTDGLVLIEGLTGPDTSRASNTDSDCERQLREAVQCHKRVSEVPVWLSLHEAHTVGIAGTPEMLDDAIRAAIIQLATWHSPHQLTMTILDRSELGDRWDWTKWLPHFGLASSAVLTDEPEDQKIAALEAEVSRRKKQAGRGRDEIAAPVRVLIVRNTRIEQIPRLIALAQSSVGLGVYVLWCASVREELPILCRWIVDLNGTPQVLSPDGRDDHELAERPAISIGQCEDSARTMAGVLDISAAAAGSGLPSQVAWRDVESDDLSSPDTVARRWQANDGKLNCVLGGGESSPVVVSLRADGPHTLVAGTTGSGKSELLQAMIMSLATRYSPHHATFLLVDYKGGAAFTHCAALPHTVGLITDLDDTLVQRVLVSLRAELRHREHVLAQYRVKDLVQLESEHPDQVLAPLIIVIDEFAALVNEVPQFIDGVVDIAQRGRSLGLHLVLATQRPAGVIKDNVRANTSMRIALRVADDDDSLDVLGVSDAAEIDRGIPGRAYVSTGPRHLSAFQSTFLGSPSRTEIVDLPQVSLLGRPPSGHEQPNSDSETSTDIEVLVRTCAQTASQLGLDPMRRPWLDPLPEVLPIESLMRDGQLCAWSQCACVTRGSSGDLILGRVDQPNMQRQICLVWPTSVKNLVVVGGARAGKTTALHTMAIAITDQCVRNGQLSQIDVITADIDEHRNIAALESVGNVIAVEDVELIERLLQQLVADHTSSRFVLLDGLERFVEFYEDHAGSSAMTLLKELMQRKNSNVRVAVTARMLPSTYHPFAGLLSDSVILGDTSHEVLTPGGPSPSHQQTIPGRGRTLPDGLGDLVQVATVAELTTIGWLNDRLRSANLRATTLKRLPRSITAAQINEQLALEPATKDGPRQTARRQVPVGLAADDLSVVGVPVDSLLVLCGPPGSGRSTVLGSILNRVHKEFVRPVFFGGTVNQAASDAGLTWHHYAVGPKQVANSMSQMEDPDLIVIADAHHFIDTECDEALAKILADARRQGIPAIVEVETLSASRLWALCQELKSARDGIVLCPDDLDPLPPFHARLPRSSRADYSPGRGFVVSDDDARLVQCARN